MKRMKRLGIAILLICILLCFGSVSAEKPIKEPVDKLVLIHYKDKVDSKGLPATDQSTFYRLLGVKWKTTGPVQYFVNTLDIKSKTKLNPSNPEEEVEAAFEEWDSHTTKALFTDGGKTSNNTATYEDGQNIVFWKPMNNPNVIATTYIWYTRYSKEIVDADIWMNNDLIWGIDSDGEGGSQLTDAYDIRDIATHEVGHVCGLGDLYNSPSRELTMYGYSALGEVKKDSLGTGDTLGLQKLYGL